MGVKVIGSGEAFDSGRGNTSYLFSGPRQPTVLFDCGYQIPERLWAAGDHKAIDAIAFTHLHADHAFGFVPLLGRFWEEKRKKALHVFAPRGMERHLTRLCDMGYPGLRKRFQFPLVFHEMRAGDELRWRGLRLRCARTEHSVLNHTIRMDAGSRSFSVSGDGLPTAASVKLVEGADLHLQECYTASRPVPGHASLRQLKELFAGPAAPLRLGLAHHARHEIAALRKRALPARWFFAESGRNLVL